METVKAWAEIANLLLVPMSILILIGVQKVTRVEERIRAIERHLFGD